ncbi:uncharacterized protein CTRU02_201091 [Colletotrichum truncatum]|uniref:Uncharacterized protein n=1 Tax=Colletotrichum truncatum TaxID=5467 RepID=A0ACC3ZGG1_COLTU|nr:uncharacterized protein CTRU02_12405 [Colletotrichum truncatum]KAF6784700.1 hypothetical protein CTRU02_12405 [Colletotrichum truncatum]
MSENTPFYSSNVYDEKTMATSSELGYRQTYIKNLIDEIPSELGSVDDTRTFVQSLLQYRRVFPGTVMKVNEQLLWTGEELHRTNKENLINEMKEYGFTPSQAGQIAKDLLEVRDHYKEMKKARDKNPNATVVFKPKTVPEAPPGAIVFAGLFMMLGLFIVHKILRFIIS